MSEQSATTENIPLSFDDISEPIVKTSGDSTMEVGETEQLADALTSKSEKKQIAKLEKELTKEASNGKEKESQKSEKESVTKSASKEKALSDEVKEASETTDKAFKTLKLEVDGKSLELRDDAIIPTKVSGKLEKPTLRELQADYAGRTDYTRKYQDFFNERKSFTVEKESFVSERDGMVSSINKFWEMSKENPLAAAMYIGELQGRDPDDVKTEYLEMRKNLRQSLREMSDEQLTDLDRQTEVDFYRKKDQSRKADEEKSKQKVDISQRVDAIRQKHNIEPATFKQRYDELAAEAQRNGMDLNTITPEMVEEYHVIVDRRTKINDYVKSAEDFPEDKHQMIASQLKEVWTKNPDLTIKDIEDIGREAFGKEKTRSGLAKKAIAQKQTTPKQPQNEAMTWDDIT